jgi:hypothetical protein
MAEPPKQRRHYEDRYTEKLRLYDGLRVLPNKVSRANSAVIWIAAIHTAAFSTLAVAHTQWFVYLIVFANSVICCSLAVWREKNAKPKQKEFTGKSPPELGISAADI